jgi:hypothetical protein
METSPLSTRWLRTETVPPATRPAYGPAGRSPANTRPYPSHPGICPGLVDSYNPEASQPGHPPAID